MRWVSKGLWKLFKTSEDCNGCGLCKKVCPVDASAWKREAEMGGELMSNA